MRKLLLFIVLLLVFSLVGCNMAKENTNINATTNTNENSLSGSASTEAAEVQSYEIYTENDTHYLKFNLELPQIVKSMAGTQIFVQYPEFSSVSEMKDCIEATDIPEDQLYALYQVNRKETIEIIDLDTLYDVSLPTGLELRRILWYGDYYSFEADAGPYLGCVQVLSKQAYEEKFDLEYANFSYDEYGFVESQNIDERNATKIYFQNSAGMYTHILYKLEAESKTLYVREFYVLQKIEVGEVVPNSADAPNKIEVFGMEDDGYFYAAVFLLDERPSVDWLLSLGIRKV